MEANGNVCMCEPGELESCEAQHGDKLDQNFREIPAMLFESHKW